MIAMNAGLEMEERRVVSLPALTCFEKCVKLRQVDQQCQQWPFFGFPQYIFFPVENR